MAESSNDKKPKAFLCPICDRSFMARGSVYKHVRQAHNTSCSKVNNSGSVKCQEDGCEEVMQTIEQLREHLEQMHNKHFDVETVIFSCYQDFIAWKSQMELKTKSSFCKIRGDKKMRNGHVEKYWCNRSGFYSEKRNKRMRKRNRATCKIGSHCTATLTVNVEDLVTVQYCSTHYSHETDIKKLPLPFHVLADIANDLQNGLERNAILDNHKSRIKTQDINRSHMLTSKDIYNVEQRLRSLEHHRKECRKCRNFDFFNSKCKRARTVAKYAFAQEKYDDEQTDLSDEHYVSIGTEGILDAIGFADDELIEKKKEHIELLLSSVRAKMLDCQSSTALSSVAKSIARNLYELNFPPSENSETSQNGNASTDNCDVVSHDFPHCKNGSASVDHPYKGRKLVKKVKLNEPCQQAVIAYSFAGGVESFDHAYVANSYV